MMDVQKKVQDGGPVGPVGKPSEHGGFMVIEWWFNGILPSGYFGITLS